MRQPWCLALVVLICGIKSGTLWADLAQPQRVNVNHANSAANIASTPQVTARLLSSHAQVAAGQTLTLAIDLEIAAGWHTYWRNPGDSGTVTTIAWRFSHPAKAGDILWPIPERHRMGPIVNYGYAQHATLPVPVAVGALVRPGELWRAEAVVDWLVCHEECIPQQVKLALALPVVSAPVASTPPPEITRALQQQPINAPWPVVLQAQQKAQTQAQAYVLTLQTNAIPAHQNIWFFPDTWGRIAQSVDQTVSRSQDAITIALTPGDAPLQAGDRLSGVVVVGEGDRRVGYAIAPVLPPHSANKSSTVFDKPATSPLAAGPASTDRHAPIC